MTAEGLFARKPYAFPSTSMERHVADLVEHLRDGADSRSGFAAKIEDAMAHAYYLEIRCRRLEADNQGLRKAIAINIPNLVASSKFINADPDNTPRYVQTSLFEWRLEPVIWRCYMTSQNVTDDSFWRKVRKQTFRDLLKKMREQFDKTFPAHPSIKGRL